MTMIGQGSWRWGCRWKHGSLLRVALLSLSGHWDNLYSPDLGNEGELVTGHWLRGEDPLWKDSALVLAWIFPFSPFCRGVGSNALVCRAQGGGYSGFGELYWSLRVSKGQPSLHPSPGLSAVDSLCVLSGTNLSEQWWGNNSLKVIPLEIVLLCKWDKEQMQKSSSSPGLTQGTNASGGFSEVLGLSSGTGGESNACAVPGVQILRWVTPVLFRELDKS